MCLPWIAFWGRLCDLPNGVYNVDIRNSRQHSRTSVKNSWSDGCAAYLESSLLHLLSSYPRGGGVRNSRKYIKLYQKYTGPNIWQPKKVYDFEQLEVDKVNPFHVKPENILLPMMHDSWHIRLIGKEPSFWYIPVATLKWAIFIWLCYQHTYFLQETHLNFFLIFIETVDVVWVSTESVIYVCIFFFRLFSIIAYYKILSVPPCAVE